MPKRYGLLLLLLAAALALIAWAVYGSDPQTSGGIGTSAADPIGGVADQQTGGADQTAPRTRIEPRDPAPAPAETMAVGFSGRVVNGANTPLPGVAVHALAFFMDTPDEQKRASGTEHTDARGRFTIRAVEPGGVYTLVARFAGFAPHLGFVETTPAPGEIVDVGDIVLKAPGVVSGRVVDGAGAPLAGAEVRAVIVPELLFSLAPIERFSPEQPLIIKKDDIARVVQPKPWVRRFYDEIFVAKARSNRDGTFRLAGVPPITVTIAVTSPGRLPATKSWIRVRSDDETRCGTFQLGSGVTVAGEVVDDLGRPVPGAEVLLAPESRVGEVHIADPVRVTDEAGRFTASGMPRDRVIGAARRAAGDPWTVGEAVGNGDRVVLRVPSVHTLTLDVRGPDDKRPERVTLGLTPTRIGYDHKFADQWGTGCGFDLDRRRERLADGRHRYQGVPVGDYTISLGGEGFAPAVARVAVEADTEATIRLSPPHRLVVQVRDGAGQPVAKAKIEALPVHATWSPEVGLRLLGFTGDDGSFATDRVGGQAVHLVARHPESGTGEVRSPLPVTDPVVIVLAEPGAISGMLSVQGRPPARGEWRVRVMAKGELPLRRLPRLVTPASDGSFQIRGLLPGEYRVSLQRQSGLFEDSSSVLGFAEGLIYAQTEMWEDVLVVSGQTASVEFDPAVPRQNTGRITGRVAIDGASLAGLLVTGRVGGESRSSPVDRDGKFDLGEVRAGLVKVELKRGRSLGPDRDALWTRIVRVVSGEHARLVVSLQVGSVAGVVRFDDDTVAPDCLVEINGSVEAGRERSERVSLATRTDPQGRFTIDFVNIGSYRLDAYHRDTARGTVAEVRVTSGQPPTRVNVTLQRVFSVSGRVDVTGFTTADETWMLLEFRKLGPGGKPGHEVEQVPVDLVSLRFHVGGLTPGTYRIRLFTSSRRSHGTPLVHEPDLVLGTEDIEDYVVRPQSTAPPPEEGKRVFERIRRKRK